MTDNLSRSSLFATIHPNLMAMAASLPHVIPPTRHRLRPGERGIWQRRYWEHTIRDERDYATHMDYIHFNPVKHGLVQHPASWPFSTFHRCVAQGVYPAEWGGADVASSMTGDRPEGR